MEERIQVWPWPEQNGKAAIDFTYEDFRTDFLRNFDGEVEVRVGMMFQQKRIKLREKPGDMHKHQEGITPSSRR